MAITARSLKSGRKSGIGTSAVALGTGGCTQGVLIKADADNAGIVSVGPSGVTHETADATDGYQLAAGEEVFIAIDDLSKVYLIASTTAQAVSFLAT